MGKWLRDSGLDMFYISRTNKELFFFFFKQKLNEDAHHCGSGMSTCGHQ